MMTGLKTLIVEDDFTSRLLLQEYLKVYGIPHIAANGREAVEAVRLALETRDHYDLICLDIMMPELDGQQALREIRALEGKNGIGPAAAKIVMTTTLGDHDNVMQAARGKCNGFLVKPIERRNLVRELVRLDLIRDTRLL
jgi:two-component system chemotaxis response regulator CheY